MTGLGAWYKHGADGHRGYKKGDGTLGVAPTFTDQMVAAATLSIKKELAFRGYDVGVLDPRIGVAANLAIRDFQESIGHTVDGVVGQVTSWALYKARAITVETKNAIPDSLLQKQIMQESSADPGAQGFVDPVDHGLIQINQFFHPEVTLNQASDGQYSMNFAARSLVSGFASMRDWDGAVAAYNIGTVRAIQWVVHGKPAHLFATPSDPTSFDFGARATQYVAQVRAKVV